MHMHVFFFFFNATVSLWSKLEVFSLNASSHVEIRQAEKKCGTVLPSEKCLQLWFSVCVKPDVGMSQMSAECVRRYR